ncbi:hypothetical protein F5984_10440 [Rudanella paleaurantiibacter]|uniref:DUF2231 domain-containing protein n=1 Tax=Rudanella paleaurantiibacter TaxID=2614655 RepID=A0A7J5U0D1_9BACT|nr:hypothetical protein [Rudanella paleaurantiibacter]KAB7731212.1 hypothetical protein F5984_10440 [Rudanella paleaurantiibacter]
MNAAHFHLVVNHLPIIFPIAGSIVLVTALISKSEPVKRTAYLLFIIGSLTAIAAMNSGEGAEEVVEHINGVSEEYIEKHEEVAKTFAILTAILGGLSLLGLWASFKKSALSTPVSIGTLIFAAVVLFFGKETGTTGGEIRHTEIRAEGNQATVPTGKAESEHDE